jgi:sucrose-6F-phosphate phosphohydrolase
MGPRRILVSDIDGTLVGDDAALARFAAWYGGHGDTYRLVYATGRLRPSLDRLIATTDLPEPDALISAVGTEIHDPTGRPWPGWPDRLLGWDSQAVRDALRVHRGLRLQADEAQTQAKVSYDVPGLDARDLAAVEETLDAAGLDAIIVYSQDLHLDVLPAAAGKGRAARFLAEAWAIGPEDVLAFGDSGNDIELFRCGFRGTLVANALPELQSAVGDAAYRSPFPFADGVLDGIRHWSGVPASAR